MRQTVIALTVFGAALGLSAGTASGQSGCPAGHVVQSVDFATKTVVCASLSTKQIVALEAKVAALQAKLTALQAQLASLLTSPNGQYSINVGDTGIELAGPGVLVQLRDTRLEMTADTDTLLTSGRHYLVTTGADMSIETGGSAEILAGAATTIRSAGATTIQGGPGATPSGIQINGSVDIGSINDIEIRAQGGLDIFTSAHHLHY